MHWPFVKYTACGNDFILFDNRTKKFPFSDLCLIQRLCHRHLGIGADGILLMEDSHQADFRMRIFNSDGSEAEMCGNGLRCFVDWIVHLGFRRHTFAIEIMDRIFLTSYKKTGICIEMGPVKTQWNIPITLENQAFTIHYIHTGVPHAIIFMDEIETINLAQLGSQVRHHIQWKPQGTNVTLAQVSPNKVTIRTFERGVEAETLACGTGATAAALAAAYKYSLSSPIMVQTRSGEELSVGFSLKTEFSKVTLTGSANFVFEGQIHLDEDQKANEMPFCAAPL